MAIAAEHKPEDEIELPKIVRAIRPDYKVQCGQCLEAKGRIRADILYFD
jgi:hypothetical protein